MQQVVNSQSSIVNIPPFPWFPSGLRARIAEEGPIEYEGRMPRSVRKVMRKPLYNWFTKGGLLIALGTYRPRFGRFSVRAWDVGKN
jgi:hypothetical protein